MTPISARSRRPDECRDIDAVEQLAGLLGGQHRGLAALDDMLGPAHGVRRVDGEDLADDQPVEQHADRGEVLLDGRLGGRGLQRLDIGGDVDRLDVDELDDAVLLEPGEEMAGGPVIGHPGVLVADVGGEEFEEPARRMIAGIGDRRRHGERAAQRRRLDRRRGLDDRRHVAPLAAHADT